MFIIVSLKNVPLPVDPVLVVPVPVEPVPTVPVSGKVPAGGRAF